MTASLWIDSDSTVDLGGTMMMYKTFKELSEIVPMSQYPELFGVPEQVESAADADPEWLKAVRLQARSILESGRKLNDRITWFLTKLRDC